MCYNILRSKHKVPPTNQCYRKENKMKPTHTIIPPPNHIRYRFIRLRRGTETTFEIYVQYRDDQLTLPIPAKEERTAKEIYRLIVNARVTPCTLSDVLEDLDA